MVADNVSETVAVLRRFNRSFTQRIGVLDDSFLGTGRPLGPARLLFEIGEGSRRVQDLRALLGLDSGYLSRLLRTLEAEGLVKVHPDPHDRRRRVASLTRSGRREWQRLEDRSQELSARLVAPLTTRQRSDLVSALTTIDRLTRASTVTFHEVPASHPEAVHAMTRYFSEIDDRFDGGFDPGDTLVTDAGSMTAPEGAFVVAHGNGSVVACGGVKRIDRRTAEIKRMWVDPKWRGLGLGVRLLANLESHATRLGYRVVRLDTNSVLVEAITMYERSGYNSIERYNDNPYARRWFEKRLDC